MCPSCTRDTDGIAAKLLRCGIASEALRRNMPLRGSTVQTSCHWECPKCTPPPKNITGSFLFVELILSGLPEKSVTWLPHIISGAINSMGLPESLAGSQRGVRRCEFVMNQDYRKYWYAITRNNSCRINLGQLPENSVIGNLWLPEKSSTNQFGNLFGGGYWKA